MLDINRSEMSDYDAVQNTKPHTSSQFTLWNNRRKSEFTVMEQNNSSISNQSSKANLAPLSQRVSIYRKKHSKTKDSYFTTKINPNSKSNSSVVFTRRKFHHFDTEEKPASKQKPAKTTDYTIEGSTVSPMIKIQKPAFMNKNSRSGGRHLRSKDNIKVEETGYIGEHPKHSSAIFIKINKV